MTDMDVFETRFARAYRRYLVDAPIQVDASAQARAVITSRRPRLAGWSWPLASQRALIWVALVVLTALAVGAALVGSGLLPAPTPPPRPVPQPTGLSGPLTVLAVSSDEAWVGGVDTAGTDTLWHVVGEASSVLPVPTRDAVNSWPFDITIRQLLRTPDGSLWATDGAHEASVLQGTSWRTVGLQAFGVALGSDGMVRVAEEGWTDWAVYSYALLEDGKWVERSHTAGTGLAAWPTHIAVGKDGTIWAGNTLTAVPESADGLLRYSNAWELVDPLGGDARASVSDLAVAPNGDVWVTGADWLTSGPLGHYTHLGPSWIARFDGSTWTVFLPAQDLGPTTEAGASRDAAPVYSAIAVGPDGALCIASDRGLFRYDGASWSLAYAGVFTDVSVADDGTAWMIGPSGLARLELPTRRGRR